MNVNQRAKFSSCIRADIKTCDFVLDKNKLVHHLSKLNLGQINLFCHIYIRSSRHQTADPPCEPPAKGMKGAVEREGVRLN